MSVPPQKSIFVHPIDVIFSNLFETEKKDCPFYKRAVFALLRVYTKDSPLSRNNRHAFEYGLLPTSKQTCPTYFVHDKIEGSNSCLLDSPSCDYFDSVVGGLEVTSSCTRNAHSTSPEIRVITNAMVVPIVFVFALFRIQLPSQLFYQSFVRLASPYMYALVIEFILQGISALCQCSILCPFGNKSNIN